MWPILYMNPTFMDEVGYDTSRFNPPAEGIALLLRTKATALAEVIVSRDGIPLFTVIQPVFADANPLNKIIGCTLKWTRIQKFVANVIEAMKFSERYRGANVGVFLRVGLVNYDDQLLFDSETYPEGTVEDFLAGEVTPLILENRGSESVVVVESLTGDKAIVVVFSFDPRKNNLTSSVSLIAGCIASLLLALLVYGRQVLVLSFKHGMEKATLYSEIKSRFIADMSHEIRTPLNGVIGTAELLAEERGISAPAAELVSTVQTCSNTLMGM